MSGPVSGLDRSDCCCVPHLLAAERQHRRPLVGGVQPEVVLCEAHDRDRGARRVVRRVYAGLLHEHSSMLRELPCSSLEKES